MTFSAFIDTIGNIVNLITGNYMSIYYFSDIHLENYPADFDQVGVATKVLKKMLSFFNVNLFSKSDYLILAGDICELRDVGKYELFFKHLSSVFSNVIYLPGNHEYYRTTMMCDIRVNKWKEKLLEFGVTFVDNDVFETDDLVIIASTLWGRGNGGHHTEDIYRLGLNDFKYIKVLNRGIYRKFWLRDYKCLSAENSLFIKSKLAEYCDSNKIVVVATHHSPSFLLEDSTIINFNEYIHSDFLDVVDFNSGLIKRPDLWVHGHIHEPVDYMVNGVPVKSNPIERYNWLMTNYHCLYSLFAL